MIYCENCNRKNRCKIKKKIYEKTLNFEEGIKIMAMRDLKGFHLRLTKKRALLLIKHIENDMEDKTSLLPENKQDDWCALMHWLIQEVYKRYSKFELCK
jgi:hypothetical protein